jgi:hypothetical protein
MNKRLLISGISIFIAFSGLFAGNLTNANTKFSNSEFGVTNDTVTVSFAVNGTAACKSAIESILTSNAGVISASWDATAKVVTVTYLTSKLRKSDLYTFLATAGYDNAELRAKTPVYNALPAECQYTRAPETE